MRTCVQRSAMRSSTMPSRAEKLVNWSFEHARMVTQSERQPQRAKTYGEPTTPFATGNFSEAAMAHPWARKSAAAIGRRRDIRRREDEICWARFATDGARIVRVRG